MENLNQTLAQKFVKDKELEAAEVKNVAVVKMAFKFLDEHNMAGWKKLMDPDCKAYFGSVNEPMSIDDLVPLISTFYTAFPDYKHIIKDIFAANDKVVAYCTYTGTHQKKFMDLEPTGNKIQYKGIFIFKLENGLIKDLYGVEDELTMMTQLGLQLH